MRSSVVSMAEILDVLKNKLKTKINQDQLLVGLISLFVTVFIGSFLIRSNKFDGLQSYLRGDNRYGLYTADDWYNYDLENDINITNDSFRINNNTDWHVRNEYFAPIKHERYNRLCRVCDTTSL